MSQRKRINLSVDPVTYGRLREVQEAYGFHSICELLSVLTRLFLDRRKAPGEREFDLPDDDGDYIDGIFSEFADGDAGSDVMRYNCRTREN